MVIAISTDPLSQQQKFTEKEKLNFPLLADPEKKVAQAFGVLNPKNGFAQRATFVIDKQGTVAKVFPNVGNAGGHPEQVLEYVQKNLAKK